MKKYFLTALFALAAVTTAHAQAAKPAAKPAAAAAPATPWNGFYFGLNGGYAWGTDTINFTDFGTTNTHKLKGGLFGAQAGFDIQRTNAVFGFGLLLDGTNTNGSSTCPNPLVNCNSKMSWLGSVTGRVGVGGPKNLVYLRGGLAYSLYQFNVTLKTTGATTEVENLSGMWGWTGGIGAEHLVGDNLGFFVQYDYYSFNKIAGSTVSPTTGTFIEHTTVRPVVQAVMVGVNWRR